MFDTIYMVFIIIFPYKTIYIYINKMIIWIQDKLFNICVVQL